MFPRGTQLAICASMNKATTAIHAHGSHRAQYGEVSIPIYQSSTFAVDDADPFGPLQEDLVAVQQRLILADADRHVGDELAPVLHDEHQLAADRVG